MIWKLFENDGGLRMARDLDYVRIMAFRLCSHCGIRFENTLRHFVAFVMIMQSIEINSVRKVVVVSLFW